MQCAPHPVTSAIRGFWEGVSTRLGRGGGEASETKEVAEEQMYLYSASILRENLGT